MNLQGITYKSLCQNLALTEVALRGKDGAKVSTSAKGGRSDQLEYMRVNFPEQWVSYEASFTERMSKPLDTVTVLATIPKDVAGYVH